MIGTSLHTLVEPTQTAQIDQLLAAAAAAPGEPPVEEVPLATSADTWVDMRLIDLLDHPDVGAVVVELRDVTMRKDVETQLRRVDAMRTAFLEAVSHDLRTPLTIIGGIAETLRAHSHRLTPEQRTDLEIRLCHATDRLGHILSDLLDLNRFTRGVAAPQRRAVDVTDLVQAVVDVAGRNTHTVRLHTPPDPVDAQLDPAMIERITENLLGNALKHTPAGSHIDITVDTRDDTVIIEVSDDGPGIDEDLREAIFRPFERGDAKHHSPGSGIGLALVRAFTELHEGTVTVTRSHAGGACFTVALPRSQPEPISLSPPPPAAPPQP